jgi:hypothetical protein
MSFYLICYLLHLSDGLCWLGLGKRLACRSVHFPVFDGCCCCANVLERERSATFVTVDFKLKVEGVRIGGLLALASSFAIGIIYFVNLIDEFVIFDSFRLIVNHMTSTAVNVILYGSSAPVSDRVRLSARLLYVRYIKKKTFHI